MEKNLLIYKAPAGCFEEALPIGNGSFGGMVYGGIETEKISLNHDTLSSGTPKRTVKPNAYGAFLKAREFVLMGGRDNKSEAEYLMKENVHSDWTQNYLPMGNIYIKSNRKTEDDYVRSLDMNKAVVAVQNDGSRREYIASNPDDCIVIKITEKIPSDYEFTADSLLRYNVKTKNECFVLSGECPSNLFPCDRFAEKPCSYDGDSVTFTTVLKVKTDGKVKTENEKLIVENALETVVYICTETSFIDYNTLPVKETYNACFEKIEKVSGKTFDEIKERHIKDYSELFERTDIDFKSKENDTPTDEMLKSGKHYKNLAEKMFSFGKYLMISSSRQGGQATNLQGIWNEDFRPPWCCNYTLNINTEMNYWPCLGADLAELQDPLTELVKKVADTGSTTAREFYKAPGFVSHGVTDLWGVSTPCGPKAEKSCNWAFWNMSAGWLLRNLYERYEYTLDKEYLEKEVYPLMRGAVEFYKFMLIEDNGKMIMSPSTSPENTYVLEGENFGLAKYTAMTQEILTELFTNYVKCCEIIGIEDEFKTEIESIIPKLDIFEVGSRGQLLEWDEEFEETDEQHRHVSHLYGVYPSGLFTNETRKDLYDASRKSLEIRGDDGTGWSISWKISLWAKFKEGNHSFDVFKNQLYLVEANANKAYQDEVVEVATQNIHGGTYINLFDAHPPFQIDGNFGAMTAIMLWILQCEDNRIKILPALPDELSDGSAKGLMTKGNIKLDIEWEKGVCIGLSAYSPVSQSAVFEVNGEQKNVSLTANEKIKII